MATSSKLFVEYATQTEFIGDETQKRDVSTQEPTSSKLFAEATTQTEVVGAET